MTVLSAAGLAIALIAGCSSSGSAGNPNTTTSRGGSSAAASCSGAPLKLMTIFSLTGQLATTGRAVPDAAAAAVKSVNATCAAGRPIQVTVCDDQSTPNGSLQCGQQAKKDGDLALIGFTQGAGSSDQGAETANLPGLFTASLSSWDKSNRLSYPDWDTSAAIYGQVLLVKALGRSSFTLAAVDLPPAHLAAQLAASAASRVGVRFTQNYFPLTTTDFSPIAAKIVNSQTGALNFLVAQPAQYLTALSAAGFDRAKTSIVLPQGILTPTQIQSQAATLEGAHIVGSVISTAGTTNPGIQQMRAEYRAAGKTFSATLPDYAVQEWTSIHALAMALKPLGKSALSALTSTSLVKAVIAHGSYSLPTLAPFDFSHEAFPSSSVLGKGRNFSKYQQVFKIENGKTVPVGSFQSLDGPFSATK